MRVLPYIQGVSKKYPAHIFYVNDNLIYAHLQRLPHVGFATFFLFGFKFMWVNDVSVHKLYTFCMSLTYQIRTEIFLGHPVFILTIFSNLK